jgi:hypothetical protein
VNELAKVVSCQGTVVVIWDRKDFDGIMKRLSSTPCTFSERELAKELGIPLRFIQQAKKGTPHT